MARSKTDLIRTLIADFVWMFPTACRDERLELFNRLSGMEIPDLELLVSQCEVNSDPL